MRIKALMSEQALTLEAAKEAAAGLHSLIGYQY